jgi:cephalosporin-C deacetylase-like acetyl esterase
VGAALARSAAGQHYRTYSRCLPEFLSALAREAYDRRNRALAVLTSPDAVAERQAWVRKTFWELVGGTPERTPLNLRTLSSIDRPGYRMEKIVYESQPELHIPANLYLPATGKPPYPGVLFQMGHSLNGKAAEPYQKCCQALARLGYVVLAFDPMGQGERTYYPRPGGTLTRLGSADDEHTVPGKQLLLSGDTSTRLQTWDAVRSLDVLAAHPLVDSKRLASTGQSGGGTLTMLLAAVDDRLAVAAVSSGNTENLACADFNPPGSVDDAEQNFIDSGPKGFDRWDLLYPLAPKPLLVTVSARDFFGTYSPSYLTSGQEEFGKLAKVYGVLGHADRIQWFSSPLPHALSPDMRLAIYRFFEKWLHGSDRQVAEPDVSPEPEKQLWVGSSGNVVRDFGSTTPQRMAEARARKVQPRGGDLRRLLRISQQQPRPVARVSTAHFGDVSVHATEIESEAGVFLPGWFYVPGPGAPKRDLLITLEPQGRNARWREDDLYHRLALAGFAVCALDVRGIGDLSPEVGRGNPYYTRSHSVEDAWAWASLILGRPLLGQRVLDVLAGVSAMRVAPESQGRRITLAARDKMTVPALCAAALDSRVDRVLAAGGLKSWRSLTQSEDYKEPFANFLPGVLSVTDLPAIRESLGPRLVEKQRWDFDALSG